MCFKVQAKHVPVEKLLYAPPFVGLFDVKNALRRNDG